MKNNVEMTRTVRRLFAALLGFFAIFSTVGCYDYAEINDTSMVAGIGIDRGEGAKYAVSVETVTLSDSKDSESESGKVITQIGESIEDCLLRASTVAAKKLLFSHCKIIAFSEEILGDGIAEIIDYFIRSPEFQLDMHLCAVVGDSAKEFLSAGEKNGSIASYRYADTIKNSYRSVSVVPQCKLYRFPIESESAPLPAFRAADGEYGVDGCLITENGKEVGILNREQTQTLLIFRKEFRKGEILLSDGERIIPCQIRALSVSRRFDSETETLKLSVRCNMNLTSLPQDPNSSDEKSDTNTLTEKLFEEKLRSDFDSTVAQVGDAYGFQTLIYRTDPSAHDKMVDEGCDFTNKLKLEIECRIVLEDFGLSDERILS